MTDDRRALRAVARLYGVQGSYANVFGARVQASVDSMLAVLRALGAPIASLSDAPAALRERREELARRRLEPVIVAWDGRAREVTARVPVSEAERAVRYAVSPDGEEPTSWTSLTPVAAGPEEAGHVPVRLAIGERLDAGRHRLWLDAAGERSDALVLSAPIRCPQPTARWWGLFAPLYALRDDDDWGIGSFRELDRARDWIEEHGGRLTATLPLFAQFLEEPLLEPSPYSPASRLFWNETYLDVERAPGLERCLEARDVLEDPAFREQIARMRKADLTDHAAVAAAKRRVLDPLAQASFRETPPEGLRAFAADPRAADYARFRAEVERTGTWWGAWPQAARDGSLPGSALEDERARYHLFVQWLSSLQ
ncbi:MAG TPA: 4-alpha-glucanotransferase, partial [Actinomycetota bacterium]|nr:4-alpha-glucanotransferase [Actinomycetota bacterium]